MTELGALILYPSWALAVLLAATAARLGRSTGRGLVALCLIIAYWVTGLILFELPATSALADHIIPAGMLLAGGFVHAGADVAPPARWLPIWSGYAWGGAIGLLGAVAPRLLYAPGMTAPGPLFWPICVASAAGAFAVHGWMAQAARRARGPARWRLVTILAGNLLGVAGGGGAILLRVIGVVPDLRVTAPTLLVALVLIGDAVLRGEHGRARRMVGQGLVYALLTATLSAIGLTVLFRVLPALAPTGGVAVAWVAIVVFFAALPLDAVRQLVVDSLGRRLFADPIGTRDLADEAVRSEVRADQVERLAELGTITSAVAHEVRNPLGVIAAQAKLLERAGAPAASVAALRAQVERARRFVDDLLRYGQPRPLDVRDHEVGPIVEAAAQSVRQAMGDGAPPIAITVAPGLRVEVDRAALGDVVLALIHNAAIAAGEVGEGAAVRVDARRDGAATVIAVEDDGPGVPAELVATLFEPFVTGRGRDHRHPGTGLGLAIAQRIVARHGGTLRHQRPARGGAAFVIRLPDGGGRAAS